MSSEAEIEISKLLHSSFNGGAREPIGLRDLARMWSLEMQWFLPEVAQSLVERLHASGWLVGEADSLSPCVLSFEHSPELGWRPFLSRVGSPEKIEATGKPSPRRSCLSTTFGRGSDGQVGLKDSRDVGIGEEGGYLQGTEEEEGIGPCFTRCRTASSGEGGEPRDGPTRRDSLVGSVPVGPDRSC